MVYVESDKIYTNEQCREQDDHLCLYITMSSRTLASQRPQNQAKQIQISGKQPRPISIEQSPTVHVKDRSKTMRWGDVDTAIHTYIEHHTMTKEYEKRLGKFKQQTLDAC